MWRHTGGLIKRRLRVAPRKHTSHKCDQHTHNPQYGNGAAHATGAAIKNVRRATTQEQMRMMVPVETTPEQSEGGLPADEDRGTANQRAPRAQRTTSRASSSGRGSNSQGHADDPRAQRPPHKNQTCRGRLSGMCDVSVTAAVDEMRCAIVKKS